MRFNPMGLILASALTKDLKDRKRAQTITLLGGMMGGSPAGLLVLATAAREEREDGAVAGPKRAVAVAEKELPPAEEQEQLVEVPELSDDEEAAVTELRASDLEAVVVRVMSDDQIGRVMRSEPKAGEIVPAGSVVQVLVSKGLRVPDVVGMQADKAEALLSSMEFEVTRRDARKQGTEGTVLKQTPAAGEYVNANTTIVIFVAGAPKLKSA